MHHLLRTSSTLGTRAPCIRLCVVLASLFSTLPAQAAEEQIGKTVLARGFVTAERAGANEALKRLSPVFRADTLRSGANASAQFRMIDNALINLQQNSVLKLQEYTMATQGKESAVMQLLAGGLRTVTGSIGKQNKQDYQLKTPASTIGIRGTTYEVKIVPQGMYAAAWAGSIWIKSYSGKCDIELGEGFTYRYAFVNRAGECKELATIPPVFQDGY